MQQQSKAIIRNAIVDLSGPIPEGMGASADTARKTLSWVLGQYGEQVSLYDVLFPGTKPAAAPVVPTAPPPAAPTA